MSSPTHLPRSDEPYHPVKCMVGLLIANALLWAVIIEVCHLGALAWRWALS